MGKMKQLADELIRRDVTVGRARRGVAGQLAIRATIRYLHDNGEVETVATEFVGSEYGTPGPVYMLTAGGFSGWIDHPGRFGETFGREWVSRFYA